jgi:tetratricopeptide (TPR) repeat protein
MRPRRRTAPWRVALAYAGWAAFGVLSLAAPGVVVTGCHQGSHSGMAPSAAAVAWVESVRSAHDTADEQEARGELDAARETLLPLAEQDAPQEVAAAHARAVRQDLYFRLATLAARAGDHPSARDACTRGLALGRADDVLTANLLIARGEAHEALGDAAPASDDYMGALRINEALLDVVLTQEEQP